MKVAQPYHIELLDNPSEIAQQIDKINAFRRYIFNNAYGDFLVYPSTGEAISPHQVFDYPDSQYVPIELMDDYDVNKAPLHPETGERAIVYRSRERMKWLLMQQLVENDGQVAIAKEGNSIKGLTYSYRSYIKNIFNLEWSNKYIYSNVINDDYSRNLSNFLNSINLANFKFPQFTDETQAYCWNCMATDLDCRGLGLAPLMTKELFKKDSELLDFNDIPLIADAIKPSSSYNLLMSGGGFEVATMGQKNTDYAEVLAISSLCQVAKSQTQSSSNPRIA